MKLLSPTNLSMLVLSYFLYNVYNNVSYYQLTTATTGVKRLLSMPQDDIDKCIDAYKYLQVVSANNNSDTEEETEHVRAYYNVLNEILSIADIEKMVRVRLSLSFSCFISCSALTITQTTTQT
jgi:hypothetical protein